MLSRRSSNRLPPVKPGEEVDFDSAFAQAKAIIAGMPAS
jgi:hypothetical protein